MVENSKDSSLFLGFTPAVSKSAMKLMRAKTRRYNFRNQTDLSLNEIAKLYHPTLLGWINYYGYYNFSELNKVLRHFNKTLVAWVMRKYKQFRGNKSKASNFMKRIYQRQPYWFAHWRYNKARVFT